MLSISNRELVVWHNSWIYSPHPVLETRLRFSLFLDLPCVCVDLACAVEGIVLLGQRPQDPTSLKKEKEKTKAINDLQIDALKWKPIWNFFRMSSLSGSPILHRFMRSERFSRYGPVYVEAFLPWTVPIHHRAADSFRKSWGTASWGHLDAFQSLALG